jgi:hypothetical protein
MDKPCHCGHSIEEHGSDPKHPGSTACTECDCIAYEAYEEEDDNKNDS